MDSLIKAADVSLYWSKEHGRNQVTAAPSKTARTTDT
jgi:PleD family two-component response regulator